MQVKKAMHGRSATTCDYILEKQLSTIQPKSIVDFGAGAGKNGELVRKVLGKSIYIMAVEGHDITAKMLCERGLYNEIYSGLISDWLIENTNIYDLALFGDVLEHLKPRDIHKVIKECYKYFKNIIVVCPLHSIFNEDRINNPLEDHKTYITENYFNRYTPYEKHIIRDSGYTMMNVNISTERINQNTFRLFAMDIFHISMITLQPFGLAKPYAETIKKISDAIKKFIGNG